eukprot:6212180-Pleurochrysis_carterae.AAC.1
MAERSEQKTQIAICFAATPICVPDVFLQGIADRGAHVGFLSQAPEEQEVLFGPFTGLSSPRIVGFKVARLWFKSSQDVFGLPHAHESLQNYRVVNFAPNRQQPNSPIAQIGQSFQVGLLSQRCPLPQIVNAAWLWRAALQVVANPYVSAEADVVVVEVRLTASPNSKTIEQVIPKAGKRQKC